MNYRESLIKLIRQECGDPIFGVEVGVHRGATSAQLLRSFLLLTLAMVDLWGEWNDITPHTLEEQKQYRQEAMTSTLFAESRRWVIDEESTKAAMLLSADDGTYKSQRLLRQYKEHRDNADFVFIDADHSYEACTRDMEAWWPVTETLFCGHDYGKPEFGVTQAVTEFCEKHDVTVNVAEGHIWWISKHS